MASYLNQNGTSASEVLTYDKGGSGVIYHTGAGSDKVYITGGAITVVNDSGNDTFTVTGGRNIKLRGGDSADLYNISTSGVDMQLGYGNDEVNVTAGDYQTIKANLGVNTINLAAGTGHVITADIDQTASKKKGYTDEQIKAGQGVGYGVDKLNLTGTVAQVVAHLGDGRDVVNATAGSKHEIYTEGWSDYFEICGTTNYSKFYAGNGDDDIFVYGNANHNLIDTGAGNDYVNLAECGQGTRHLAHKMR